MNKPKYSPGPWRIRPLSNEIVGLDNGNCDVPRAKFYGGNSDEIDANGNLIAAAPDLLEALERLYAVQNGPPLIRDKDEWEFAMRKSEIAIINAREGKP